MKMSLTETIDSFNLKETKDKVSNYFTDLQKLEWEHARLNVQRGLIAKYEATEEDKNQPYVVLIKTNLIYQPKPKRMRN